MINQDAIVHMSTNNYDPIKAEQNFNIDQNTQILEQYILQKSAILEKLKNTLLLPYLLNMTYMVGNIGSVKVTEDPIEELGPLLNSINGINQTLNVKFTREELVDWEIFKYTIFLFENDEYKITEELNIYLLIRLSGNSANLLIFGILDNTIVPSDKCQQVLDNDIKIKDTKIELGLI